MATSLHEFSEHAFSAQQLKVSIKTAVIVGTLLNIINQWQALSGQTDVQWLKLFLTYLVPYCVATYAGAKASLNCVNLNNG